MPRISTWTRGHDGSLYYSEKFVIRIPLIKIVLAIVILLACMLVYLTVFDTNSTPDSTTATVPSADSPNVPPYFSEEGFLFPNSSTVRLSTSEIRDLQNVAAANGESYRNLLRYAVNEIYARHGYLFNSGQKFDTFYSQFEWYRALPKQTTVTWAAFNETERYNLGLLLAEEERNGYR